jgi:hypothetical protein
MAYEEKPGSTTTPSVGGEYNDDGSSGISSYPIQYEGSDGEGGYQVGPGATGNLSAGGEYDNLDTADSLSYTNLAAQSAGEAALSAAQAATSVTQAASSAANAVISATNAATSATNAANSATAAGISATNAANSATSASTSATTATTKAAEAATSATSASASATTAATQATVASASATSAANSASTATTKASEASTSATNAASSASTATTKASEASASASSAATSAATATTQATNAATSATNAASSATSAGTSASNAATSASVANTSATDAAASASTATTKASEAAVSATTATTQATNAASSATSAATSATSASESASTATTKAAEAVVSADSASTSATAAGTSAANAATSATAAGTSATDAAGSATSAFTNATNAASSASSASTSATSASTSAATATTKADEAATSATTATTKASEAASSATSAATSATTATTKASEASTSAANAASSATNAATSETAAGTSATNAAASATSASGSASTATTKASEAATSAANALASETLASTSAATATTQATNAATSATSAAGSATSAADSATTATTQANNAFTSATNAANSSTSAGTSATNAANSATSAATSATSAGTSATNAAASATSAGTSASNATTSATSAATAQAAAEAARDQALAAFDNFDDKYLGEKATDPTTDNDGNPLVTGALYFNTTTNSMKVYSGTAWLDAYASLSGALLAVNNLNDVSNVVSARSNLGLGTAATTNSTAYATAAQGTLADNAVSAITSNDGSVVITTAGTSRDLSVGIAGSTATLISQVRNETGATLAKGTLVYISGAAGNKALVSKALATGDSTSAQTYGMVQADISNNNNGYVVVIGVVSGLDTSTFAEGAQLYLSGATAGAYTSTKPYAPLHLVYVGVVTRSHANLGTIEVKIQNGYEMDELHDVSAQSPTNGDTLVYVSSTGLWTKTPQSTLSVASAAAVPFSGVTGKPTTLAGYGITDGYNTSNPAGYISGITSGMVTSALGYTPYNATNPSNYITTAGARAAISVTGAGSYDSATGVINIVGGVTSFNTRTGAITLNSSDVTTALGFTPYNATNPAGYITSTALSPYLTSATAASTYAPLTGTGASGTWSINVTGSAGSLSNNSGYMVSRGSIGEASLNSATSNGFYAVSYTGYSSSLITWNSSGSAGPVQMEFFYQGNVRFRNQTDSSTWTAWKDVLTNVNYNSYAPTLTGTGASGTWSISISGNSATATTASNSNNLGNKPAQDAVGANTIPTRDGNGYTFLNYINSNTGNSENPSVSQVIVTNGSDNYYRKASIAHFTSAVQSNASGTWSINVTGNSAYASTAGSADAIDGVGFRNTGSNSGTNADTIESNGITYYTAGVPNFTGNATDGALYSQAYSSAWQHQIAGDYRSGQIALRGKNNGTWQSWRTVLDSSNYTSYAGGVNTSNSWAAANYFVSNRNTTSDSPPLQAYSNNSSGAIMAFHRAGQYAVNMGLDSDNVFRIGGWSAPNSIFQLGMSGDLTTAASSRAPIFYDSNNTAYFTDPASRSRQSSIDFGDGGYYIHAGDWGMRNTTPYGWIQFGPANTSHAHIYTDRSNFYFNAQIQVNGGSQINTSDIRANIFYDQQDTSYYFDGTSTTRLNAALFVGPIGRTTSVAGWFQGTYNNVGDNSMKSNPIYTIGSSYNPSDAGTGNMYGVGYSHPNFFSSGRGSGWGLYTAAAGTITGVFGAESGFNTWINGYGVSTASWRAPLFYDNDDTSYYIDPNSTSQTALRIRGGALHGPNPTWGSYLLVGGDGRNGYIDNGSVASVCSTNGNLHLDAASGYETYINYYDGGTVSFGNGSSAIVSTINTDGSHRPQIIYDYNDTGYYLNPNGSSFLYGLVLSGNMYFRPNSWIQQDSSAGIYWPNHYGAHFYPNGSSTYTQLQIDGSKNSYSGMFISHSAVNGMMYDGGGNGGVYREANGRWYFYHNLSNNCMGVGTSSTNAAYGIWVTKGGYFDGRVDGTIFYDANDTGYYCDPNGTARLNSIVANSINAAPVLAAVAATGAAEVGTYGFMRSFSYGSAYVIGQTVGGSVLNFSAAGGANSGTGAGTWRCMGYSGAPGSGNYQDITLWLRIS